MSYERAAHGAGIAAHVALVLQTSRSI